jgi:hypothetical protein
MQRLAISVGKAQLIHHLPSTPDGIAPGEAVLVADTGFPIEPQIQCHHQWTGGMQTTEALEQL